MKSEQTYYNDQLAYVIELWFKSHTSMTKDNYDMMKEIVWFLRNNRKK